MNRLLFLRRLCVSLCISMIGILAFAQGRSVEGVITDASGEPMIGVNVLVKGTTNGAVTDMDGKFVIHKVKSSDVLSVSYIGYTSQDLKVGSRNSFTITLREDSKTLDEVVVTDLLLALPTKHLCREDCRGLCPHCGKNLNEGECGCRPDVDPRLAVLEQLLDK